MLLISSVIVMLLLRTHPGNSQQSEQDLVRPEETHLEGVPKFLQHPKPLYYTAKGRPAQIECIAEPVSHVSIYCADKDYPYMNQNSPKNSIVVEKLDAVTGQPNVNGVRWKFTLAVKATEVEEWFGDYYCHCTAWNQVVQLGRPKKVESEKALVKEACT